MAFQTNELDFLIKRGSVVVRDGDIVVKPQFCTHDRLELSKLVPKFNGCYAVNNSTVAFVFENQIYVAPETNRVHETLRGAGFRIDYFPVPFSSWDYPLNDKVKWETLREKAREAQEDDFAAECVAYANEVGIGEISSYYLKNCFEIPAAGVVVDFPTYSARYHPVISAFMLDMMPFEKIGRYCKNNGKVVFVYQNGKTYVTKGYKIVDELIAAGYKEESTCVPFSRGEVIRDPELRARWEAISKF